MPAPQGFSWIEKPLAIGAVTPSGKALARTMAAFVDPKISGPIVELGPGTGPVTDALVAQGIDPARLVLVEFDPTFCRLLRARDPTATVVQGDAYSLRRLLHALLDRYDIPAKNLHATHITRSHDLLEDAVALAKRGAYVVESRPVNWSVFLLLRMDTGTRSPGSVRSPLPLRST